MEQGQLILQTALPPIISLVLILISTNCPDRKHGREDMPGHVKWKTLTSIITEERWIRISEVSSVKIFLTLEGERPKYLLFKLNFIYIK